MQQKPERRVSGVALVLAGLISQEAGAATGVLVFPLVGPLGAVGLRVTLSAVLLLIVVRPSFRGHSKRAWQQVVGYGLVLAAMNTAFYLSIERIPLGVAVTIEVLGPLALSVASRFGLQSIVVAGVALSGVAILGIDGGRHDLDTLGILFGATAGACWAVYILLARQVGNSFTGMQGLTLGMSVASVATLPLAIISASGRLLSPTVLLAGLALAVLSSAVPYAAELLALRRLDASTFSVLTTLAPVIAALFGFLLLNQTLSALAWSGIALVVTASAVAVWTTRESTPKSITLKPE